MCHSLGSSAYKRSSSLICAHGIVGRRIRGGGRTRGTTTPGRAILTLVVGPVPSGTPCATPCE